MAAAFTPEVLQDTVAVSLAQAVAAANKRAREMGINVQESLITISQTAANGSQLWRINYGPRDYMGQRGGDLIVEVDPGDATVKRVFRGQ